VQALDLIFFARQPSTSVQNFAGGILHDFLIHVAATSFHLQSSWRKYNTLQAYSQRFSFACPQNAARERILKLEKKKICLAIVARHFYH
jgi:hypothetical protein